MVRRLEARFCSIGKRLVPGPIRAWWTDEVGRLDAALGQHHARVLHHRDSVRQARARLAENQVREAILASQVETYIHTGEQARAYQLALDLDRVRNQLAEDRARLSCDEKAWKMHRERIAELERRLAEVRRQLRPWVTV
jgi:hypothetical protein